MRAFLFFILLGASASGLRAEELASTPAERSPASVRVTLPADARLTFSGRVTRSTGAERVFVTPPLEVGRRYSYSLAASFFQGEKTITVEQEIFVSAGRESVVSLEAPAGAPASAPSRDNNAGAYGLGGETRVSYYYGPPAPPAPPRADLYLVPGPGSGERSAGEGRSPSTGFTPPHWGVDPSDPFYHSQP
jgi:uncharacterized protein (TIGR03000 family)